MSVAPRRALIFLPLVVLAWVVACHAQQKFPVTAIVRGVPDIQYFETASSGLDDTHTFTDLSSLNDVPAGGHGFVRVNGGHFSDDRGTRLRFFGINLTGVACLPDRDVADRLARHFRKLGFNAVHLDALDVAQGIRTDSAELAPDALERLDYFTASLKAQGIYFALGLHAASGYPGLDGEAQTRFPQGKVLDRFHPAFLNAQRDFARRLLSHENPYTHAAYGCEPALLYVELNREDTIFPSTAGSPDDAPASYRAELASKYGPWLTERTAEGFRAPGPADEEAKGELPTFQASPSARADYAQFLRATERDSVAHLMSFVRNDLKLHSMLINSQVTFGGLAGVLREADASDFIDAHGYWDRPHTDRNAAQPRWALQNTSQVMAGDGGTLGALATYRVFGKPFSVSEYASSANDYAAEMLPLLIGIAGLQDWDAVFAFAYADQKRDYDPARINGTFDMAGHPAKLAFVSSAANAFRRGLVQAGSSRLELRIPTDTAVLNFAEDAIPNLWSDSGIPATAAALRQLGITLQSGSGRVTASSTLHVSGALGSDTGELFWETQGRHPHFSIDAPSLKLVCGVLTSSVLKFGEVSLEFGDFAAGFACASLVALDDLPIAQARRLLFTVAGRAENAQRAPLADGNAIGDWGTGPALAQFVPVTLSLPRDAWHAEALDASGASVHALPVVTTSESKLSTALRGAALSYSITR